MNQAQDRSDGPSAGGGDVLLSEVIGTSIGGARETFGYDTQGRRTSMANAEVSLSMVYDALNRMTEVTNHTLGQTITYGYDAAGNRTSMTGPQGTTEYLYDAKHLLVEQHDPATGTYRLTYDADDRRTGLEYPNGVTTEYEYDAASRLTLLLTTDPLGNTLDGYRYEYNAVGNRTSMRSLRDGVLHEYEYDAVDRLTVWQRGPDRFEAYDYDQVGNRQQLTDERGTTTYQYDLANRLTQTVEQLTAGGTNTTDLTWDPNGNLLEEAVAGGSVTTYTWDALNRLTALDGPTGSHTYGYDPNGIRVRETNGAETTRFLHGGEDILATYRDGQLTTYYAHGPGIDEPWAQLQLGETEPLAYLHRDGLGSVTAVSSPQGQLHGTTSHAAFGGVEQSSGLQSRYGYTSRELDPTGNLYYRSRCYQPKVGRFASKDPLRGTPQVPLTLHSFAYVRNMPTQLTDPTGEAPSSDWHLRIVGDGDFLALLYIIAPYLLTMGQLARLALRISTAVALKYLISIYAWMAGIAVTLQAYLISVRAAFAGQVARFAEYLGVLAIIGLGLYFAGMFNLIQLVSWARSGASFLAFTVFLYMSCVAAFPSSGIIDAVASREVIICTTVAFYIWAVVNLPTPPPRDF